MARRRRTSLVGSKLRDMTKLRDFLYMKGIFIQAKQGETYSQRYNRLMEEYADEYTAMKALERIRDEIR